MGFLVLSYLVEGVAVAIRDNAFIRFQDHIVHIICLAFIWGVVGLRRNRAKHELWVMALVTLADPIMAQNLCSNARTTTQTRAQTATKTMGI